MLLRMAYRINRKNTNLVALNKTREKEDFKVLFFV